MLNWHTFDPILRIQCSAILTHVPKYIYSDLGIYISRVYGWIFAVTQQIFVIEKKRNYLRQRNGRKQDQLGSFKFIKWATYKVPGWTGRWCSVAGSHWLPRADCAQLFPILHSVISSRYLEISHCGSNTPIEIAKHQTFRSPPLVRGTERDGRAAV